MSKLSASSDESLTNAKEAIEGRTGRTMAPGEVDVLFDRISGLRCVARQVHVWEDVTRDCKELYAGAKSDKAALERVMGIIEADGRTDKDSKQFVLAALERQLSGTNNIINAAEGRTLNEILRTVYNGDDFEGAGSRRKQVLEVVVLWGLREWFNPTGDDLTMLQIGHPDRPGPFLRFLGAIATGVQGGITLNSLYDKTRQIVGRRGRRFADAPPQSPIPAAKVVRHVPTVAAQIAEQLEAK